MMFNYCICNQADEQIFSKQCTALENNIPLIEKLDMLEDVDGSKRQKYRIGDNIVTVFNSVYLDEVYVESDVDLLQYFK